MHPNHHQLLHYRGTCSDGCGGLVVASEVSADGVIGVVVPCAYKGGKVVVGGPDALENIFTSNALWDMGRDSAFWAA